MNSWLMPFHDVHRAAQLLATPRRGRCADRSARAAPASGELAPEPAPRRPRPAAAGPHGGARCRARPWPHRRGPPAAPDPAPGVRGRPRRGRRPGLAWRGSAASPGDSSAGGGQVGSAPPLPGSRSVVASSVSGVLSAQAQPRTRRRSVAPRGSRCVSGRSRHAPPAWPARGELLALASAVSVWFAGVASSALTTGPAKESERLAIGGHAGDIHAAGLSHLSAQVPGADGHQDQRRPAHPAHQPAGAVLRVLRQQERRRLRHRARDAGQAARRPRARRPPPPARSASSTVGLGATATRRDGSPGISSSPTSRSDSPWNSFTSRSRVPHEAQLPMCACISFTSCRSSSPSSRACRVPSSRCDIVSSFLPTIRLDQPPPGSRQRRTDRAFGQSQRGGDLVVPEPFRLEEEGLAIALVQLAPTQHGPERRPRCGRTPRPGPPPADPARSATAPADGPGSRTCGHPRAPGSAPRRRARGADCPAGPRPPARKFPAPDPPRDPGPPSAGRACGRARDRTHRTVGPDRPSCAPVVTDHHRQLAGLPDSIPCWAIRNAPSPACHQNLLASREIRGHPRQQSHHTEICTLPTRCGGDRDPIGVPEVSPDRPTVSQHGMPISARSGTAQSSGG